ncbi:MAG: carbohydrate ABC transporter permease [Vallitalea sp.]|jgi:putative aldouronate transport system permease protein|nr:carbohydrate ABC transporter permease [Vallitalea sp.]
MKRKKSRSDKVIDFIVYASLIIFSLLVLFPFLQVITISLSPTEELNKFGLHIFPKKITFEGYKSVLSYPLIGSAYLNTIFRTVVATVMASFFTILAAYPLSKKYLPHKKFWTLIIIFTMYFSGGLIPKYMLIKDLGMINHRSSLILPALISAYNLIITRNFLMMLPESMEEAAKIDGASHFKVFAQIVVPVSKPIIATISLWYGVWNWNAWFDSMLYMLDEKKYVLQHVLRKILLEGQLAEDTLDIVSHVNTDAMKMATLIVAILPIICIYPFAQKYFVKGVVMGSVKE